MAGLSNAKQRPGFPTLAGLVERLSKQTTGLYPLQSVTRQQITRAHQMIPP